MLFACSSFAKQNSSKGWNISIASRHCETSRIEHFEKQRHGSDRKGARRSNQRSQPGISKVGDNKWSITNHFLIPDIIQCYRKTKIYELFYRIDDVVTMLLLKRTKDHIMTVKMYVHFYNYTSSVEGVQHCQWLEKFTLVLMCTSLQVFVGSASEGILYPGDKLASINYQDASKMTHLQAQNIMKTVFALSSV